MLTFGIKILLLLLFIGGIIAYLGDYLGTFIGRKRLTIFNLRPRYTAYAITVITGILIVFVTMGVILAVSQDARTALFGLEEMRQDLAAKGELLEQTKAELSLVDEGLKKSKESLAATKANLRQAKKEIVALEQTKESLSQQKDKLSRQVEKSQKGKVLFTVDEVLLTSIIMAGPEKAKIESGLKQILSATDAHVRTLGITEQKHLILISPENFNKAVTTLTDRRGENIVKVTATRNTLFGEIVPVRFDITKNDIIYKAQEAIAETTISSSLSIPEIEQQIKKLLTTTHLAAKNAGVIPDQSGSVGSIPYAKIYALAKKIKTYKKGVRLVAVAKEATTRLGPLDVDFKVFYQ